MAESLLGHHLDERGVAARVRSAGLLTQDQPASAPAVDVLAGRGLDLSAHRSQRLVAELIEQSDLVLCMERAHLRESVLLVPDAFPRIFTLKELVRRGEAIGPRRADEPLPDWLAAVHEGRRAADYLGSSQEDDVADPIGRPRSMYEKTAAELDDLVARLVDLLWGEAAPIDAPSPEQVAG
jgi:protein-tyrosine phosphatase